LKHNESQLTKYFREQIQGESKATEVTPDELWKSRSKTQRIIWLKAVGATPEQIEDTELAERPLNDLNPFWQKNLRRLLLNRAGVFESKIKTEEKLSVLDKFENGFNTPNRCVDCGLSRKAHDKGGIGHPFKTRKQARSNSLEVSRADALLKDFQRQFGADAPQDAEGALDFLRRNGIPRDEAVRTIQAMGGAIEAKEVKDEIEFWNNASPGLRRSIGSLLDIDNVPWKELTPAEQGSLGVWWDRNKRSFGGEVEQAEVSRFLDALRDSGVTNMFGAGTFVEKEFGISKQEARNFLTTWMKNFGSREILQTHKGQDAKLWFNRMLPDEKENIGMPPQATWDTLNSQEQVNVEGHFNNQLRKDGNEFYNYDGAEKLDSREDDTDDFVQGMMGIRAKMQKKFKGKTKKELEDMGIFGLGEATADNFWNNMGQSDRLVSLDAIGGVSVRQQSSFLGADFQLLPSDVRQKLRQMFQANDSSIETKRPIGALSSKKISRLRSRMTPDEREDAGEFYQYESVVIKKKASEINQSQWDSANHSTRKRWVHKHVQGVFMIEEDDVANLSWRELDSRIKQELKEQENLSTEFMDHGLRRKIEASEELVSWGLKAGSGRGAASQVQQVVPIVGGTMKAALMNTEDGEWSFIADFKKPNDAKIFRDSLKDTATADGWINIK